MVIFIIVTVCLTLFTAFFYPEYLFYCIKNKFSLWCSIIVIYPLFSVFPQEIVYRGFLFERYKEVFKSEKLLMHLSALFFSFAHIIYMNPVAIILTLGGGYLFSWTYMRTKSILLVSIEHALYGLAIFSLGLGRFFYFGFEKMTLS